MRSPAFPGLGHAGISFQTGDGAAEQHWRARNWAGHPNTARLLQRPEEPRGPGQCPGAGQGGPPGFGTVRTPQHAGEDAQGGPCRGFGLCSLRSTRAPWPGSVTTPMNGTGAGWKDGHSAEIKPPSSGQHRHGWLCMEPALAWGGMRALCPGWRRGEVPPLELGPHPKPRPGSQDAAVPGRSRSRRLSPSPPLEG